MTPDHTSESTLTAVATPHDVRWKRWLRRVLLVVSCLCVALSVILIWLRIQIDDTDRFVRTVSPVASNAAIQEAVIVAITDRFSAWLDDATTRDTLGDRQRYLAAPLNSLLTDFVEKTVREVVTSDQFQQFWVTARETIHPYLSALLTGSSTANMTTANGKVSVNLSPIVQAVVDRLDARGIDIFDRLPSDRVDVSIVVADSPELANVQGTVHTLYSLTVLFPIVALLALGGYLWLSLDRRLGVVWAGLGLATTMAVLLLVLALARWRYIDGLDSDVNQAAAKAFFDILGRYLRAAIRLIALLGLVVAAIALLPRPKDSVGRVRVVTARWLTGARRVGERGFARLDQSWIERNRAVLLGVLIAVFCLCVITPNRITQGWGRAVLLITAVGFVLIWLATRSATRLETAPAAVGLVSPMVTVPSAARTAVQGESQDGGASSQDAARESLLALTRDLSADDLKVLSRIAGALRDTS
jgi:hypothetical protein